MNQIWYVVYVEPQVAVFIKYGAGARCKSKTVRRHNQDRSRRATNHRVTYSDATGLNYPCYRSWWPFHNVPECSNTPFLEINDGQPPCLKKVKSVGPISCTVGDISAKFGTRINEVISDHAGRALAYYCLYFPWNAVWRQPPSWVFVIKAKYLAWLKYVTWLSSSD